MDSSLHQVQDDNERHCRCLPPQSNNSIMSYEPEYPAELLLVQDEQEQQEQTEEELLGASLDLDRHILRRPAPPPRTGGRRPGRGGIGATEHVSSSMDDSMNSFAICGNASSCDDSFAFGESFAMAGDDSFAIESSNYNCGVDDELQPNIVVSPPVKNNRTQELAPVLDVDEEEEEEEDESTNHANSNNASIVSITSSNSSGGSNNNNNESNDDEE